MTTDTSLTARLVHFPVTFFAVILGMAGFALSVQKASQIWSNLYPLSTLLVGISALFFLVVGLTYLIKVATHPSAVKEEITHPIKVNFYPLIAKILLIFSVIFLDRSTTISLYAWAAGTATQFVFSILIVSEWIQQSRFKIEHLTPGWFIPIVGSIMVPIAGVPHGHIELSWFFFSVGLVFWMLLMVIVLYRIFFHAPIAERMLPTMFILFAPPAIGFIAWCKLNGGVLDSFGRILYYFALFMFFLVIWQIPRLIKIRFFLSWWAYSFPLAAITLASFLAYEISHEPLIFAFFVGQLLMLTAVIIVLCYKTVIAIRHKEVCVED